MGESKVLKVTVHGLEGHGTWARIRLASGEIVDVSIAGSTVRVRQIRLLLGLALPGLIIYEGSIAAAFKKMKPVGHMGVELTQVFLGKLAGTVSAIPSVDALRVALPDFFGPDAPAVGE